MNAGRVYTKRRGTSQGGNIQPCNYPGAPEKSGFLDVFKKAFDTKPRDKPENSTTMDVSKKSGEIGAAAATPVYGGEASRKESRNETMSRSRSADFDQHVGKKSSSPATPQKMPVPCGLENLGNTVCLNPFY